MKKFGLIGFPLSHSFSAKYFAEKFQKENIIDVVYNNYPLQEISEFEKLISDETDLFGLNVTIPYKESVIPFLDNLSPETQEIGAVNVIKIGRTNNEIFLKGFNTDYLGFWKSLQKYLQPFHKKALILGTGGSSKAVAYALKNGGIEYQFVSRKEDIEKCIPYSNLTKELFEENLLIINTTPVGMAPYKDIFPQIPYKYLTSQHLLFDLIYNPAETKFLKLGKNQGATTVNGAEMLVNQAELSWGIFNQ